VVSYMLVGNSQQPLEKQHSSLAVVRIQVAVIMETNSSAYVYKC
jgi:hypothetical protein